MKKGYIVTAKSLYIRPMVLLFIKERKTATVTESEKTKADSSAESEWLQ